jgi:hypothetical protein
VRGTWETPRRTLAAPVEHPLDGHGKDAFISPLFLRPSFLHGQLENHGKRP